MNWMKKHAAGISYVLGISIVAYFIGRMLPIIGGPVFGLLIGMILSNTIGKAESTAAGIVFCSKKILQWSIILLGCGLSLTEVWKTGSESLLVMLITLLAAFAAAYGFGRLMNIPENLNSLIAVGTGICGGSAIAAVSPIIKAKNDEIAYGISVVFFMNMIAVLAFPSIGHWLHLSDEGFGLWAGTAIHDTSSVVAAGYIFSDEAGAYATIVKLTRTTLIIPIVFVFAIIMSKREQKNKSAQYSMKKVFPWFIVWFLAASLLNTMNLFSQDIVEMTHFLAKFMIIMALSAIGLSSNLRSIVQSGYRPLVFGFAVWIAVTFTSLAVQYATGQW